MLGIYLSDVLEAAGCGRAVKNVDLVLMRTASGNKGVSHDAPWMPFCASCTVTGEFYVVVSSPSSVAWVLKAVVVNAVLAVKTPVATMYGKLHCARRV